MVNHIIKFFQGDQDQLRKYEDYYTKEIKWKMMNAELKTAGLNQVGCDYCYHLCSCYWGSQLPLLSPKYIFFLFLQVNNFVKISNKVPWQVNKWRSNDMQKIKSMCLHIEEYIRGNTEYQNYTKACNCGHHEQLHVSRFAAAVNLVMPGVGSIQFKYGKNALKLLFLMEMIVLQHKNKQLSHCIGI